MFVLSWIKFFRGYVYVHLTGYATERFLNLCGSRNILIWNLKPTEDGYYFYISVDGYRSLKPILKKTKTKARILKKYGVPFQLFRYRKHKVFAAGIAVSAVLLFYCSGFVWNIEVKGNSYLSEETILTFLQNENAGFGVPKRNINCEELEEKLRSAYSEVIWTSVKVYGTKMTVELQENLLPEEGSTMAYTDDWESLMNGVFGAGGKLKFGGAQPQPEKPQPEKPAGSGLPDLNAALLEQQKQLDALLKQQNARLKAQDAGVQTALEDSRQMLRDMEADGLLAKGTADTKPEQLGSFEGLAAEVKKTVLGQDAFVDSVVRAMRRPFVLGTEGAAARNVILLWGAPGTGRHFALAETARIMAARGLLQSDRMAVMDLALYPDPGAEKLFLQDLYAALHAPGEIVVFEHYESCHPGFLRILSDLAVKGSAPLSSRYLVNKEGILVEAGTALAPGAVSRIDPCGKYLIFFSRKGREALADKFGASFVAAVGDVCQTAPFTPEALAALAAQQLNALAQRVHSRLGLTLTAGAEVRDYVAAQCSKEKGAEGLADCCERIFRALSEYCLQTDAKLSGTVALTAAPEGLQFALNGAAPADLFSLLPAAYTGAVEQIRAELDALVGLAPVKEYVFGLADNLQVQQRRAAAGFKTASLSMHMIFTGNPGTGKTTIARLVAKYLKAIGALKGGQLVEVTRADLVGRYTGHTAPLTNSVIESALGGVLFIDEAYSLYRGQQDSFGLEAIDTLVKGMEDHRDELVVILAGYTKEMEVFLTANSGLASRFPNKIEFPDYTADELLDITAVLAKGKGYRLAEGCTFPLLGYYKRRQALDSRTAGNGRLARNTLEKAIFNQSRRLIAEPAAPLDLIQPSDLEFEE